MYFQDKTTGPVTKEDLGRATWRFLHTLAAKSESVLPVKANSESFFCRWRYFLECTLVENVRIRPGHMDRIPHKLEIKRSSHNSFAMYTNTVNRSLGKLVFPCERVDTRWGVRV
ncbi:unnamed protein product [Arabidopsis lyrata]|nr:unnamed protein product [Arabidopsis lyrata]